MSRTMQLALLYVLCWPLAIILHLTHYRTTNPA